MNLRGSLNYSSINDSYKHVHLVGVCMCIFTPEFYQEFGGPPVGFVGYGVKNEHLKPLIVSKIINSTQKLINQL